jgi:lysozyme
MYTVQGTDCSNWQNDPSTAQQVDFNKMVAAGAKFTFIKASQETWLDRDFTINWNNAKKSGIARGAYHYLSWGKPAIDQARFFAGVLKADPGELPPVVDFEESKNCPAGASVHLENFCDEFERLSGRRLMIYTSYGFWKAHGTTSLDWLEHKLWVAHYTTDPEPLVPLPWSAWTFWQYTSRGDGPAYGGEAAYMDLNWYHDTLDAFYTEFGLEEPGPIMDKVIVDVDNLRLRTAPVAGSVLAEMTKGTALTVLERKTINGQEWLRVQVDGWAAGWLTKPV